MIEVEEHCDDRTGDHGNKNPLHRQFPEWDEEDAAVGRGRSEGCLNYEGLFIESGEFANIRHANEDDDRDSRRIFGEAGADVAVEKGFPGIGS